MASQETQESQDLQVNRVRLPSSPRETCNIFSRMFAKTVHKAPQGCQEYQDLKGIKDSVDHQEETALMAKRVNLVLWDLPVQLA